MHIARGRAWTAVLLVLGAVPEISRAQTTRRNPDLPATIKLRTGVVNPMQRPNLKAAPRPFAADQRYVIQLDGPLSAARQDELKRINVRLGDYLPDHAFIARLDGVAPRALAALPWVRWVGDFDRAWKLDPNIGKAAPLSDERTALRAAGKRRVNVWSFDEADRDAFAAAMARAGVSRTPLSRVGAHWNQIIDIDAQRVAALADEPTVQYVEEVDELTPRNASTAWIVQSNISNNIPLWDRGLHGEGQLGALIDWPVRESHCAFDDFVAPGPTHRKFQAYYGTPGGSDLHGTHTCGTFIGDWAPTGGDACFNGLAWAARGIYRDVTTINVSITLYDAFVAHHNDGARMHSNSYGNGLITTYNINCVYIDQFSRDYEDNLVFFAVVNSPTPNVRNPENAKNVVAVAAGKSDPNQHQHQSGGAAPTADGRRKPDLMAPGELIDSAYNATTCGSTAQSGTSFACPAAAAMGMLVRQYFEDGFYPSGMPQVSDALNPSGALVKAVLLNSCVDMTGINGYPSNSEGWGRLLLDDALYFAGDSRKLWFVDRRNINGLTTGQMDEYYVLVLDTTPPLKVTLVFTDVQGTVNSAAPVVNNLNLEVIGPSGTSFKGNVFNATGESTTGGSYDTLNNVEQVHRRTLNQGIYTVRVHGAAVNGPSGNPRQGYALVVTGGIAAPAPTLYLNYPAGLPEFADPDWPLDLPVELRNSRENVVAGTPTVHHRVVPAGGPAPSFDSTLLTSLGGNSYLAPLPAAPCGDAIEYYFTAQGSNGGSITDPPTAPAEVYRIESRQRRIVLDDAFEVHEGWTVDAGATGGNFQRGIPAQTLQCGRTVQPGADHTPGACDQCYVTGAAAGSGFQSNDVDGGPTRLVSPRFDLSAFTHAELAAYVWFYQGYIPDQELLVQVSDDDGANWTTALSVPNGRSDWQPIVARIQDHVQLTNAVRVRFSVQDSGADYAVEALVDDVTLTAWGCNTPAMCVKGDVNQDGSTDGEDIQALLNMMNLACLKSAPFNRRCAADMNEDGSVDAADVPDFVDCLLGNCP